MGQSGIEPPPMHGQSSANPQGYTPANQLFFKDGQAYTRTGNMSQSKYDEMRSGSPKGLMTNIAYAVPKQAGGKGGVEPKPYEYKPLGYTAQEAGYFGPGRYGAARRYGQDSVTNPDVPQEGNFYQAGR